MEMVLGSDAKRCGASLRRPGALRIRRVLLTWLHVCQSWHENIIRVNLSTRAASSRACWGHQNCTLSPEKKSTWPASAADRRGEIDSHRASSNVPCAGATAAAVRLLKKLSRSRRACCAARVRNRRRRAFAPARLRRDEEGIAEEFRRRCDPDRGRRRPRRKMALTQRRGKIYFKRHAVADDLDDPGPARLLQPCAARLPDRHRRREAQPRPGRAMRYGSSWRSSRRCAPANVKIRAIVS